PPTAADDPPAAMKTRTPASARRITACDAAGEPAIPRPAAAPTSCSTTCCSATDERKKAAPAGTAPIAFSRGGRSVALVAAQGVLGAAEGVLDLALDLLGLAFRFQFFVAGQLADAFLDLAASGFGGAF